MSPQLRYQEDDDPREGRMGFLASISTNSEHASSARNPAEGFAFWFNLALIAGVVLAAPFVMYHVWGFIAPGLYASEKRFVIPFVLLTSIGNQARKRGRVRVNG